MKRLHLLRVASIGLAAMVAASPALAQFGPQSGPPQQQQGFENTSQNPANYLPEETAAVDAIVKWVNATNAKDLDSQMALIGDDIVYRGDPSEYLGRSARGFCSNYAFIRGTTWVRLDELYTVGGPDETLAIFKRVDIESAAGVTGFGGFPVEVGVFARVKDGKIIEWLDEPVDNMGFAGFGAGVMAPRFDANVPDFCMQYPDTGGKLTAGAASGPTGGSAAAEAPSAPHPVQAPLANGMVPYGTMKTEARFKADERAALVAVRSWFAAWQAGNPELLGSFVDKNAVFRPTPDADIVIGRDNLLKSACATMGEKLKLSDVFAIGSEGDTLLLARWDRTDAEGNTSKMGSFFRVKKGLVVEWLDVAVDGTLATPDPNSDACQSINTTLAAFAPLPIPTAPVMPGAAPAPAAPAPAGAPSAGAPPAGGPPA